ncbi:MAG TPA: hypothetical protein VJI98_04225 [Candidatus Nanoarchaeia archaeon]|nr:hypothetical protein [Candidatus Nanoarchaeia archaeon]
MRNKLIILLSLILLVAPALVSADIIPVGYKGVSYCFEISNIEDYQDYTFIAYFQEPMGGHKVISKEDCVSFYKFSNPIIYAIKNSDFNEADIGTEYEDEKLYFSSNPNLLSSNFEINSISTIPENDPKNKIVDVLEITSLSENNFVLTKSKVVYTYTDGTTEEITYTNQNTRPEASRQPILPRWFAKLWYIIIPLIAVLAFVAILLIRKFRK